MSGELVAVAKGGEVLLVHPTCLAAHIRAGWVEVAGEESPETDPAPPKRPVGRPRKTPNAE